MKKIILFSRNDLTHLYGGISDNISKSADIIHLAYSTKEEIILNKEYKVQNAINFQKEVELICKNECLDIDLINLIDELIIEQTNNRFCLNSAIQSDRTFSNLEYSEILILVQVYYKFWNNLIVKSKVDFIFHEPVALFFLQIASVICQRDGVRYLSQIQVFGKNEFNWIFVDAANGFPVEFTNKISYSINDEPNVKLNIQTYLVSFRRDFEFLLPELSTKLSNPKKNKCLFFFKQMLTSIYKHFKSSINSKKSRFTFVNHVEIYESKARFNLSETLKNKWDSIYNIKFDEFESDKSYYFYPMHTEPEAVVLYWGDGIYKNQIKLIENIAAQLPPNNFLYVKFHPVLKDQRNYIDYKRLKEVPNIKVISPLIPGKLIISKSCGVFTINGTAGFESILLNKPVFVFGNSFYEMSDRVYKVKNIRDLRRLIYESKQINFVDDDSLINFLYNFHRISKPGFIAYYSNFRNLLKIENKENIGTVADGFIDIFNLDSSLKIMQLNK